METYFYKGGAQERFQLNTHKFVRRIKENNPCYSEPQGHDFIWEMNLCFSERGGEPGPSRQLGPRGGQTGIAFKLEADVSLSLSLSLLMSL